MAHVSISDAEWQVMNVIWDQQSVTAQEVIAALAGHEDSAQSNGQNHASPLGKKTGPQL